MRKVKMTTNNVVKTRHGAAVRHPGIKPFRLGVVCAMLLLSLPGALRGAELNRVSAPAGFVRIAIPSNTEALVSAPFTLFHPEINTLFSNQLTGALTPEASDMLRKWDKDAQNCVDAYKADGTGDPEKDGRWFADLSQWNASDLEIHPGEGFWIRNNQATMQSVYLCGRVILETTNHVTLVPGFNLFSYPFSSGIALNASRLAQAGAHGARDETNADQILDEIGMAVYWLQEDPASAGNGYWLNAQTNVSEPALLMGLGYWYKRAATNSFDWKEVRPYEPLYPLSTNPPVIRDMTLNPDRDEITLTIETTGGAGETIAVYTKDLEPTDEFTSVGWALAQGALATTGRTRVEWTDSGSENRSKVDAVYARCYLVERGDLARENDGLPEARETMAVDAAPDVVTAENGGIKATPLQPVFDKPMNSGEEEYASLPFIEGFESNTVAVGDLNGQNGWEAWPACGARVQTNLAYLGARSLAFDRGTNPVAVARHFFNSPTNTVVWFSLSTRSLENGAPTNAPAGSAMMYVDYGGHLVVYDGLAAGTNHWVTLTNHPPVDYQTWARISARVDYGNQQWSVYLNGTLVASGLGFATAVAGFSEVRVDADKGAVDQVVLTLPTEGDTDGDGVDDATEALFGRDPLWADTYPTALPWSTDFESGEGYAPGNLHAQQEWNVQAGAAAVQTNVVYANQQAVGFTGGTNGTMEAFAASRLVGAISNTVVWTDLRVKLDAGTAPDTAGEGATAVWGVDGDGRWVARDGTYWRRTTWPAATGEWVRVTTRKDFTTRKWDLYVEGRPVFQNLWFADPQADRFVVFAVRGRASSL
ncbi:MAG: hypothetical protein PHW60_04285 [Kiritimatiellae bacterium]|nr:hypothetical protein [Kiritimatiellia bacterium]